MENKSTVTVIGLWHLGSVTVACLADYGHKVVGIDPSKEVVANLSKGIPPVYEPGLSELVKKNIKNGNLSFTNDFRSGLKDAQYVMIAFDTPINDDDTPDLSPIMGSVEKSIPYLHDNVLLVINSQVPVGTCEQIKSKIQKERPTLKFGIVCMPENLKLGEAISRFKQPDFLVIGAESKKDLESAERLFGFFNGQKINVSLRTAEMTKHALNSFLACEVSFANEIGNLCDTLGIDSFAVAEVLKLDKRIGKGALLRAGLGFAGGTLARDVGVLRTLGEKNNTNTILLDSVINVNRQQNKIIASKLGLIFGDVKGLRIGVLGLTYKPDTSTIRRSASIEIIRELVKAGAKVKAYDPKASFDKAALGIDFERCDSLEKVANSSDALLLLTGWPEFKTVDYSKFKPKMKNPVIIDALNMLNSEEMEKKGFVYLGIGRGQKIKRLSDKGSKNSKK